MSFRTPTSLAGLTDTYPSNHRDNNWQQIRKLNMFWLDNCKSVSDKSSKDIIQFLQHLKKKKYFLEVESEKPLWYFEEIFVEADVWIFHEAGCVFSPIDHNSALFKNSRFAAVFNQNWTLIYGHIYGHMARVAHSFLTLSSVQLMCKMPHIYIYIYICI